MGTSTSSNGPKGGVSLTPQWLNQVASEIENGGDGQGGEREEQEGSETPKENEDKDKREQPELAPNRRFANAKRALGQYTKLGEKEYVSKALGHYSKKGWGGSQNLANKMKVTTVAASKLHKVLSGSLNSVEDRKWLQSLSQKSAKDVSDEIVKAIIPIGGSIEEESCKNSMREAIFELLDVNENADITSLSDEQVLNITESFLVNEVCAQVERDLGHLFENLSSLESVDTKNEIRDYVKATIGKEFEKANFSSSSLKELNNIYQDKLRDTLNVFEQGV